MCSGDALRTLSRKGLLEPLPARARGWIEQNNAIEAHKEGNALPIAEIQTVRQIPEDNLACILECAR